MIQGLELGDDIVLVTIAEQGPAGASGADSGHIIQENGSNLLDRGSLNFGAGILATDNPGDNSTDVTVTTALIGAIPTGEKGAPLGVATLNSGGKVPQTQLPALAITNVFVVASEAEMLALAAGVGDVAIRTDTAETFILVTVPATVLANWSEITTPGQVVSVNGQTGTVFLDADDVGAVDLGQVAAPNGVASLDGAGDVPDGQIASNIARVSQVVLQTLADTAGDMIVATAADTWSKLAAPTADGQVLRRSASTVGWGAIDLADTDAVTGVLPNGNLATTLTGKTIALGANTVSGTAAEFNTALTGADFYTTAGTDVALTDGGTGASTAADARTNLGISATNTPVVDADDNYTATDVEGILAELPSLFEAAATAATATAYEVIPAEGPDGAFVWGNIRPSDGRNGWNAGPNLTSADQGNGTIHQALTFMADVSGVLHPFVTTRSWSTVTLASPDIEPTTPWADPVDLFSIVGGLSATADGHDWLTVHYDQEGYLWFSGMMHFLEALKMCRTDIPWNIGTTAADWTVVTEMVTTGEPFEEEHITYPRFDTYNGFMHYIYANGDPSDTRKWYINRWNHTTGSPGTWQRVCCVFNADTPSFPGDHATAYPNFVHDHRPDSPHFGRLHAVTTWRVKEGFEDGAAYNEDIDHVYSDDFGVTWRQFGSATVHTVGLSGGIAKDDIEIHIEDWDETDDGDRHFTDNGGVPCVDSLGRVHVCYSLAETPGDNSTVGVVHAYYNETVGAWVTTRLDRLRNGLSDNGGSNAALFLVGDDNGRMFLIYRGSVAWPGGLNIMDLTPESPTYAQTISPIFRGPAGGACYPDRRAAYDRGALSFVYMTGAALETPTVLTYKVDELVNYTARRNHIPQTRLLHTFDLAESMVIPADIDALADAGSFVANVTRTFPSEEIQTMANRWWRLTCAGTSILDLAGSCVVDLSVDWQHIFGPGSYASYATVTLTHTTGTASSEWVTVNLPYTFPFYNSQIVLRAYVDTGSAFGFALTNARVEIIGLDAGEL